MRYSAISKKVISTARAELKLPAYCAFETAVIGAEEMRALNFRTRGIDAVTDVLSFPAYELNRGEIPDKSALIIERGKAHMGDIVVCGEKVLSQSAEYGHSAEREAAFLILHGLLHILGYSHETPEEEEIMNTLCGQILSKAGFPR